MEFLLIIEFLAIMIGTIVIISFVAGKSKIIIDKFSRGYASKKRNGSLILKQYGITAEEMSSCPIKYDECRIKKNGEGYRILRIPGPELKVLQKKFDSLLRKRLAIHRYAHAYCKKKSILTNALPHLGNKVVIKLDIKKFFDTITKDQVLQTIKLAFSGSPGFEQEKLLALVWLPSGLPQGAPTSPVISNNVLFGFDWNIEQYVCRRNGKFTRYADDITISYDDDDPLKIRRTIKFVEEALLKEGFELNKKPNKLHVLRRHQSQRVCGITLNSGKLTISRKERRRLRAIQHKLSLGQEASLSNVQANGLQAYYNSVENFISFD